MGYFVIDDRPSGGQLREADTNWCRHCHVILSIRGHWKKEGGICRHCGIVCAKCAYDLIHGGFCYPFKKRIDDMMREEARRRAFWI